jgi:hypothetical protein
VVCVRSILVARPKAGESGRTNEGLLDCRLLPAVLDLRSCRFSAVVRRSFGRVSLATLTGLPYLELK